MASRIVARIYANLETVCIVICHESASTQIGGGARWGDAKSMTSYGEVTTDRALGSG